MTDSPHNHGRVIVVMGVSGSGKSHIGRAIAERLGASFHDGDDYHPDDNVQKMRAGTPLTDDDRMHWLDRLNALAREVLDEGEQTVIACSALRRAYRERLAGGDPRVMFVFLDGSFETIRERLCGREDHFFPESLLRSQFDTLEPPTADEAIRVDIDAPAERVVETALHALDARHSSA
ncbi:gluconokinase [Arhodomonas sp. AD133]|uniref:gluconokinase n=1 Tax=Arhodomonas sp. AD133 TaxID=3415009 RepID=UPI003EB9CC52